jgi:hypothetical protein
LFPGCHSTDSTLHYQNKCSLVSYFLNALTTMLKCAQWWLSILYLLSVMYIRYMIHKKELKCTNQWRIFLSDLYINYAVLKRLLFLSTNFLCINYKLAAHGVRTFICWNIWHGQYWAYLTLLRL